MPPKPTRKAPPARPSQTQGTLAFGAQNKITKPTQTHSSRSAAKKNLLATESSNPASSRPAVATIATSPEEPDSDSPPASAVLTTTTTTTATTTAPPNLTLQPKPSTPSHPALTPLELTALALPTSTLTKYWRNKDSARLHPRVHQSNLTLHEKILREFDLTSAYGPCIGMTRLRRWHRAEGLGLGPPIEVLGVLVREREGEQKGKGGGGWERAAVEGLVGGS